MEFNMFSQELIDNAKKVEIDLNEVQVKKFYDYMNLLLEWNEKMNLTAITEPSEIIVKHFIDSIIAAKFVDDNSKIIDVGTGAGFPGIPLKIVKDDINLTLLDSLNKRTFFLAEVVNKLNLKNVEIVHGRAEDFAQDNRYRECFDYAVSRAVAPLNVLLEYLVPYTKVDGNVIAMKGSNADEEIENAQNALKLLNAAVIKNEKIYLPNDCGERYILVIKKDKSTSKTYPRKAGTPKKSPL